MSDDNELKLRIAQLSGRINLKEQESSNPNDDEGTRSTSGYPYPLQHIRGAPSWRSRGAPYGRGRGIHKRGHGPAHKNRTLILNNNGAQDQNISSDDASTDGKPGTSDNSTPGSNISWIAKHDRHKQLINPAVYERETQNRLRSLEETRKAKAIKRDEREKQKIKRHLQRVSTKAAGTSQLPERSSTAPPVYEIPIHGIRFRVTNGGSRLLKISDDLNSSSPTPKSAVVGGVTFLRSKNGNLYRQGIVKAKRSGIVKKINEPCKRFTTTGSCAKGPLCPYLHDPDKVAICKTFLQTGSCPAGESCDLSHTPSPERVPACLHFLKGKCSNAECRYAHVRVNPGAPVCRPFAILGYCNDGAQCSNRHVHECPDYANSGSCNDKKCRLPHVDRAGQIRKSATNLLAGGKKPADTEEDESDLSSDDDDHHEVDSDDVDSDGLMEDFMETSEDADLPDVAQQQDFIHF